MVLMQTDATQPSYHERHPARVMALRPTPLLALVTLALAALAGCSDGPPSGDVMAIAGLPVVEGTSLNEYTAPQYPVVDPVTNQPTCAQNSVPQLPEDQKCVDPATNFTLHFMGLPEPDGNSYSVFLAGGAIDERQLAPLVPDGTGMWDLKYSEANDLSTQFERLELRMGSYVVASAPAASGSQAFVLDASFSAVSVTASYKGDVLTVDVAGLPEEGNFVGRLYTNETGTLTLVESFPVITGSQEYTAEAGNIADFAEFHIHVGASKLFVYQGSIDA